MEKELSYVGEKGERDEVRSKKKEIKLGRKRKR